MLTQAILGIHHHRAEFQALKGSPVHAVSAVGKHRRPAIAKLDQQADKKKSGSEKDQRERCEGHIESALGHAVSRELFDMVLTHELGISEAGAADIRIHPSLQAQKGKQLFH
ncbi:hypothetical protein GCM10011367_18260 [Marinicauda pacifica]|nr:hypothetical protein GCM10011367_18260 [Marinicauda pacifica]